MPRAATTWPAAGQTINTSKAAGFTFAKRGSAHYWKRETKAHTFFFHETPVYEQCCISYTAIRRVYTPGAPQLYRRISGHALHAVEDFQASSIPCTYIVQFDTSTPVQGKLHNEALEYAMRRQ